MDRFLSPSGGETTARSIRSGLCWMVRRSVSCAAGPGTRSPPPRHTMCCMPVAVQHHHKTACCHWEVKVLGMTHEWETELICQHGQLCQHGTCTWTARLLRLLRRDTGSRRIVREYVGAWLRRQHAGTAQVGYLRQPEFLRLVTGSTTVFQEWFTVALHTHEYVLVWDAHWVVVVCPKPPSTPLRRQHKHANLVALNAQRMVESRMIIRLSTEKHEMWSVLELDDEALLACHPLRTGTFFFLARQTGRRYLKATAPAHRVDQRCVIDML